MKLLAPFVEFLDGEMPPGLGVGPFFVRLKINGSCEVGTRHRISSFISQPLADPQCRPCRSLAVQEGCSLTTSVPSCLGWRQAHTAHTHNLHAQLDTHTHTHLWCWLLSLELRGVPKSQVELFFFFFYICIFWVPGGKCKFILIRQKLPFSAKPPSMPQTLFSAQERQQPPDIYWSLPSQPHL